MAEIELHRFLTLGVLGVAVLTFAALMLIAAPYGRHHRGGWGPSIANRTAWILMEAPASLVFAGVYFMGAQRWHTVSLLLLAMWQWHYVNRTFVFPFRLKTSGKRMPVLIMSLGMTFNGLNAYLNARWISEFGPYDAWLTDPRFVIGALVFIAGRLINARSDAILLALRKPGETGYKIPTGGLFRWVSSPNYFGEIIEWTGWAIATFSLPGLAFAAYTAANLVPRARANHRWYKDKFDDYPKERTALIPFLL